MAKDFDSTLVAQRLSILTSHPSFVAAAPYFRQRLKRGLEVSPAMPSDVKKSLYTVRMPCVACGAEIEPMRARTADSKRSEDAHRFVALTCRTDINKGCCRGLAATYAKNAIEQCIRGLTRDVDELH